MMEQIGLGLKSLAVVRVRIKPVQNRPRLAPGRFRKDSHAQFSGTTVRTATAEEAYLDRLLVARLLLPTSLPGIYARGVAFTQLMEGLEHHLTRLGRTEGTFILRCPPVLPRSTVETCAQLLGCLCCFTEGTAEQEALIAVVDVGELPHREISDVVMAPAACYYVYPYLTGTLPAAGKTTDIENWCYRHEPSLNPLRMRSFRMREFVHAGTPEQAVGFRDRGIERAQEFLTSIGLNATLAPIDAQACKFDLRIPIASNERPTAVISSSYHQDHFGRLFEIHTPDGAVAHTSCLAFGMERLALALLAEHGLQLRNWPAPLQELLSLC
ncbi:hypothetical protein [Armatimonas sp.]|uniref:hypothetical protein n=1 Tax=Armatimonas sp. TaxID=1872638 RepID=UPI00375097EB